MANKIVIFPDTKHAQAQEYADACTVQLQSDFEPGGTFGYVRLDVYGQWVCPYYGPPFYFVEGYPIPEPPNLLALRLDGVLHDFARWADDE